MDTKIKFGSFNVESDGTLMSINPEMFSEFFEHLKKEKTKPTETKNYTTKDLLQKLVNYLYENVGESPIEETEIMLLKVLLDENR